ncbi:oxidoreductase [Sorangium sp. So ce1078]|uniref:oxidoreductase n=1 Tax=Sorangium sp. So ce1078 TaxID=3133329 RepID=UPI003F62A6F1
MIPALLTLLALVDAAFCGFRDAAGRNPRIEKRAYFLRAIRRGALTGLAAVAALAALTFAVLWLAPDPAGLWVDLLSAGTRMVLVYGAYATLVCAALLVYALPHHDVRVLASVMILGPFTMMRPWVLAAGALFAAQRAARAETAALALASALAIGLIERVLGRGRRGRPPGSLQGS